MAVHILQNKKEKLQVNSKIWICVNRTSVNEIGTPIIHNKKVKQYLSKNREPECETGNNNLHFSDT